MLVNAIHRRFEHIRRNFVAIIYVTAGREWWEWSSELLSKYVIWLLDDDSNRRLKHILIEREQQQTWYMCLCSMWTIFI